MSESPVPVALVLTPVASAAALAGLCSMTGIDVHVVPSRGGAVAVLDLTAVPEPATADAAPAEPAPADVAPGEQASVPDDAAALTAGGPGSSADSDVLAREPETPAAGVPALADPPAEPDWDIAELLGGPGDGVPPAADELARTLSRLSKSGVVLLTATLATDTGIESGLSGQLSARRYNEGEPGEEVPPGLVLAGADEVVEDLILGRLKVEDIRGHERSGTLPRWKAAQMFAKGLRRRRP